MKIRTSSAVAAACAALAWIALGASTVRTKDGRTYVGEVKRLGGSYSIVMADGQRAMVRASDIATIDGQPVTGAAVATGDRPAGTAVATPPADAAAGSSGFKSVKAKADRTEAPVVAVQLWDDFIRDNPTSADLANAKAEREAWDKLYKENAEKVKGKWVGGAELKALKKKADDLYREAVDPQTGEVKDVNGLRKLDQIIAMYPRHFAANYDKGYQNLVLHARGGPGSAPKLDLALQALETTAALAPTVPEVWANLAIGYNFKGQYQKSIESAYRAVKIRGDDSDLLRTLATSLTYVPRNMRDVNPKVRAIFDDAVILLRRAGITEQKGWTYLRPKVSEGETAPDDVKGPPGIQWSGSGFFVSADGYLITNHHVAAGDADAEKVPDGITFRVRLDDGTEVPAELVGMDDKADIAVMKVKLDKPTDFLPIAQDNPEQGAEALVLGFPATGSSEMTLQISKGTVKSIHPTEEHNVWFDLNTTHGNSGGPIVDKDGHVIGILTAGGQVYNMQIVYGVGPNQIEDYVKRMAGTAPGIAYKTPVSADGTMLDSAALTRRCRKATVLVLAIRGADGGDKPSK